MTAGRSVLQGGQLPGRPRRRGWIAFVFVGIVVLLGALLGAMAARTRGPTHVASRPRKPPTPAVVRSPYGTVLAPSGEQVAIRLRLGLRSGLLFDVRTGQVLWARDPDRVLPIASLTKMMTALVVVAHSQPSDRVMVTRQAVHFTGSGVGLLPLGKQVPELALLYGLLLPSGNDAAIALSQHVAGTQSAFITMMNAQARQLGLSCTHFTTVSGVIDQGNYSCAADLASRAGSCTSTTTIRCWSPGIPAPTASRPASRPRRETAWSPPPARTALGSEWCCCTPVTP